MQANIVYTDRISDYLVNIKAIQKCRKYTSQHFKIPVLTTAACKLFIYEGCVMILTLGISKYRSIFTESILLLYIIMMWIIINVV